MKIWFDSLKSHISKFTAVPDEEWINLELKIKFLDFKKDDFFIRVGDIPDKLAFIVSGIFRVFYETENGDDKTLVFREENRFLSSYSPFLEKKESWFNIQAMENSRLLYITLDDYSTLIRRNPCWQLLTARYAEMLFIEKEKREQQFLSDDAETRYRAFLKKFPGIENRIHQYHITSYLGITSVALSRIRNKNNYLPAI